MIAPALNVEYHACQVMAFSLHARGNIHDNYLFCKQAPIYNKTGQDTGRWPLQGENTAGYGAILGAALKACYKPIVAGTKRHSSYRNIVYGECKNDTTTKYKDLFTEL